MSHLVDRLRHFNAWRRDHDGELEQPSPRQVGADIDAACRWIESMHDALLTALPYVEAAETDQGYKPGAVKRVVDQMRAAIEAKAKEAQ